MPSHYYIQIAADKPVSYKTPKDVKTLLFNKQVKNSAYTKVKLNTWACDSSMGSMVRSLRELCMEWLIPEILLGEFSPLFSSPSPCKFLSCSSPLFLHAYFMFLKKPQHIFNIRIFQPFPQIPPSDKSSLMFVQSLLHSKGIRALLNSASQRLLVLENSYWKRNIQNLHTALRWSCVLNIVIG